MAYTSLPFVSAVGLLAGAALLATCSSHSSDTSTDAGVSQFQADAPAVYVAKVKNLLIGQAPTDMEIQEVTSDPTQLKTLIDVWMKDPAYAEKMKVFFELAFQQTQLTSASFIDSMPPNGIGNGEGVPLLMQNVVESFARTMLQLVGQGQPLNQAMTTKTLMMTPPLMELYALLDEYHADDEVKVTDHLAKDYPLVKNVVQGTAGLSTVTLEQMADPTSPYFLHFYSPAVAGLTYATNPTCNNIDPINYPMSAYTIHWLLYGSVYNHKNADNLNCGTRAEKGTMLFSPADFGESAWRMVTIRPPNPGEQTTRFFDIPSLRTATELVINTPRIGYFSTPAFFANWSTNSSNQMRVTVNQALIVATGWSVDGTDGTTPPNAPGSSLPPGLDAAHAAPGTQCFGCHQLLDPTRSILSATWTYPYFSQLDATQIASKGEFAFQGVTNTNINSIEDFANTLATHPLFPTAWAEKLCYYANSQPCDPTDPEFLRVVSVFTGSNLSWTALVRELLASPLTTNATPTLTTNQSEIVAVSRRDHLCAALDYRLGLVDVCGLLPGAPKTTISSIVAGLPSDGYGRGSPVPVLPNQPSLFFRAGLENICEGVSQIVIDNKTPPTPAPRQWTSSMTPDGAIADFVAILMAIEPSDARSAPAQAALKAHFTSAIEAGASTTAALQSTFTIACMAPSAVGIGM